MKKIVRYIFGGLGICFVLMLWCLQSLPDEKFRIFVLDVGQGDSILIETPAFEHLLIDGGSDDKVIEQLSEILPFYNRTIDVIILTHPHSDHVNGLVEVLKRYDVRRVVMTGVAYHYSGYESFLELVSVKKIPIYFAGQARDFQLGNVILDMIYPSHSLQNQRLENQNNGSIVFRLLYGKRSFYFGGDLEMEKEKVLVESGLDLHADFLKVSHHGSKTSSTLSFLDLVHPTFAAIPCGVGNTFGHPYFLTVQHLQQKKVKTYRTDIDGMIEAESDGESLRVWTRGK